MPTRSDSTPDPPRFADRIEAGLAVMLFGALGLVPIEWASALGGAAARRIGPLLGISKRARLNLRRALPECPASEVERIVVGMWDNLGRVAAEYPHLPDIRVFASDGRVETHGFEHIDRAVAAGRRMIMFSGHLANWEIAALAATQYGVRVTQIYRAPNNPLIDRLIARCRGDRGEYVRKSASAARRAFAALQRGEHLTMLAGARFRLTVFPPVPLPRSGDPRADVAALTAAVTSVLEGWIRERPEEWLWVHRRWPD